MSTNKEKCNCSILCLKLESTKQVYAYIERKALAHSLNDTKTAVQQLHKLASAAVIVVIIVVSLLVLGVATTNVVFLVTSQLLVAGFMFQNTCKTIFESIIFVFVMHPFDVGDRCVIDGIQMIVEEMNILTTVFLRYDMEKIYYPNSVLITKAISNFRRSPEMGDSVEFTIDVSTPVDDINAMKKAIQTVADEEEETEEKVKEAEDVPFEEPLLYKELKPYVPPITFPSLPEQDDVATFPLKGEEVEKEETEENVKEAEDVPFEAPLLYKELKPYVLGAFEWSGNNPLTPDLLIMADLTGDTSGLGPFELEALQDCEYKFMSKYVKVGSIKKEEVPVADSEYAAEENEGKCNYSV
ncbi:hypothetical protein LWI29_000228 [Acer saccharum]|uniref:Mechanosensitive ion channel MscS domain-containing protein n=1 Tax=Acer saccharum TaxID=4024 RepID=A0AA39W1I7_ACESA|nr:hypothetical protein LWI29_000228 [Acer saccharum]